MSVYKRTYQPYTGFLLPGWARTLVLSKYGFSEVWSSKITIVLFVVCALPFLGELFSIALANNPLIRAAINARGGFVVIGPEFFFHVLQLHSWFALALTAWVAPRLISFDLADNALPILLSHPISRASYVIGKALVLLGLLSTITWIPIALLFGYQSYSSPTPWAGENFFLLYGSLFGTWIWIVFLTLLGLAMSAWVKWRIASTGLIFAAILVPAGFGQIVDAVLRTKWGMLLNLPVMTAVLWRRLLQMDPLPAHLTGEIPISAILISLGIAVLLCLATLDRRIRAREVVRG